MTSPRVRSVHNAMAAAARAQREGAAPRPRDPAMLREVREGLSRAQKELSPKYFYDHRGSELFEQITTLPEYYLTRTERAILGGRADEIVAASGAGTLVELGAGSAAKTRLLLDAMLAGRPGATYIPIDVSASFLSDSASRLRAEYPRLVVRPVVGDFTDRLELPLDLNGSRLFALLGSTIGNFAPADAARVLARVRRAMRPGDRFLLGADLRKDVARLEAAYNDAQGVTAEFNLNMLRVINRELGADFDLDAFQHLAFYDRALHRIEMHLIARRAQVVNIPGADRFYFARGETLRTEISCKYDRASLGGLLEGSGMRMTAWHTDVAGDFALVVAEPVLRRMVVERGPSRFPELRRDVEAAFAPSSGTPRIAAEIEAFVVHAETGRAARLATTQAALGTVPAGISFEPGGQIEYSAPPFASPSALLADIERTLSTLRTRLAPAGLALRFAGFDECTPIADVPMQKDAERYRRMDAHLARVGPFGRLMMRQTASIQVCVDTGEDPLGRWRLLSTIAPVVAAAFANAPAGPRDADGAQWHSSRRLIWSTLDPARTGLRALGDDPVDEYTRFALDAPAFLLGDESAESAPFGRWGERGADGDEWREHLTTLFPDVRPRGYFELRAADAVEGDALVALVLFVWALATDDRAMAAALAALPAPSQELMVRAGKYGFADPVVSRAAREAFAVAGPVLERAPRPLVAGADIDRALLTLDQLLSSAP